MGKPDIEGISLRMENIWRAAGLRTMQDIVRRIKKESRITSTADYQLNRLLALGMSTQEAERTIKEALNATYPEMFELYDEVANWQYVRNRDVYEQVNGKFIPPEENEWLQKMSEAVKRQTKDEFVNLAQSYGFSVMIGSRRVFTPFSTYYHQYVDAAVMDIISGSFDYNTVIRRAVKQMTDSGLRTVDYATGRSSRVDVAVRRAVMTGVSQISEKINERTAKELGTDYFEVDWHANARPSHREWQGKVYSKDELETVCGLHTVTGLCGANCRHSYYAFVPGASKRMYPDEWLKEQNRKEAETKTWQGKEYDAYERTQKQRQMETAMRAQREKVQLLKDSGASKDEVMLARCKYQAQLNEYSRYCKKMNLPEQRQRIYYDMRGRVAPRKAGSKNTLSKMKISIPDEVYGKARMTRDIRKKIDDAIGKLDKEYIIYLDKIEGVFSNDKDIFMVGGYIDKEGILRHSLIINYEKDYVKLEKRMQIFYNKKEIAGKSYEDYIAHEMAHIIPFQNCTTKEEYLNLQKKIKSEFVGGISRYSDKTKDGRESLAEAFVRYRNGEKIPRAAERLIKKYIEPWRR